ncbi:hypothetical protein ASPTUDRAFT_78529 [Aspergillus tubingensis CBS 134.48]|uniref:Carboxylesterase type B domain-containing protein n=1 Tax=Aspergillus tubingensis (strain CBS 134.48) TaxID=767770 RepID=A0A1L9MTW0_ASPTC|nr:hypothetical protein ASPTUDRAFT_78529 [Aspergillus tubingensis CBS 134.48]
MFVSLNVLVAPALFIVSAVATSGPTFARAAGDIRSDDTTVFFENDGNWTSHGIKPSALFINTPSSYADANAVCAAQNEALLSCEEYANYENLFSYQQYLGKITTDQLFWSSCSSSSPTSWRGVVQSSTNSSSDLPFLCTNSAPLVDKVDTDYSGFPRVNVTYNGTTFEGMRDHMAFRFAGIRFAQPPTGDLRFQSAQPWNHTIPYVNATSYGPACLQFGYFDGNSHVKMVAYLSDPWGNSEDCLFLNIWTPHIPSADSLDPDNGKPVMVWIYGGGDTQGSAADSTFDGASLASRSDVVVVSFNYRVNIFGLLALNDGELNGNYMMTDKIQALRWIRQNIAGFGGNPKNVTIFGQSAGGSSVNDLITCPAIIGEDLFQNGIVQSGKSNVATAEVAAAYAQPYIEKFCNGTATQRASCLRSLPAETLLDISNNSISWYTVIDGHYSADYTQARYALGAQYINSVNVLTGNMLEEYQSLATTTLWPSMSNFSEALEILINDAAINEAQAEAALNSGLYTITNNTVYNGSTTYTSVYNASVHLGTEGQLYCDGTLLQWVAAASWAFKSHWFYIHNRGYALSYYDFYDLCTFPVGKPDTPYYRCHSSDLYEVFGTYYIFDQPVRVPEDIYYTNAIQDMWGAFARTGNPNVDPAYLKARSYDSTIDFFFGFEWPQFTVNSPRVASLQYPGPQVSSLPYQEHCEVLLPHAPLHRHFPTPSSLLNTFSTHSIQDMDIFTRAQTSFLSWKHGTPLPSGAGASPKFQSWHTFDPVQSWITTRSDIDTNTPTDPAGGADTSRLVLLTWNIDGTSPQTEKRVTEIITCIIGLDPRPDIIFLQEVSKPALQQILKDERVRELWLSSEYDDTSWGDQSFAVMTLLAKARFTTNAAIGPIWRVKFPSHFARDALCCDIFVASSKEPGPTRLRLVNVHLDSLPIKPSHRPKQVSIAASLLRVAGQGLVAGDFNPVLDEDNSLLEKNGLVDAWTALRPGEPGLTWGLDGKQPFLPNRLDKIGILGLRPHDIKTIKPKPISESSDDEPLWTDHHALVCSFGLVDE